MTDAARLCLVVLVGVLSAGAGAAPAPVVHDVRMTLDPEHGGFQATDRIVWHGEVKFRFALAETLRLEGVSVDDREVEPVPDPPHWTVATDPGHGATIDIRYARRTPVSGGSQELAEETGSVFLPAGSVPDIPGVPQHYRLYLDVPSAFRAVATGRLTEETLTDQRYQAEFVIDYPSEPPSIFAGRYEIAQRISGATRLRTYFPADLAGLATDYLEATDQYLRRYSASIGAYPYSNFFIIAAPYPVGLSFPGLTYVSRRILPLPYMRTRSLAHEIVHSWWGNGVYVDYAKGNWSEGLTTYMADYAVVAADPGQAREMRLSWLRDYAALPDTRDAAVRTFTGKSHDAAQVIGYNKVAFVFHMLNTELGSAAFESALRAFWQAHRFKTASWDDLRSSFERAADRSLTDWFVQWLDRPGAPRLVLRDAQVMPRGNGYRIKLALAQRPPVFTLAIPVRLDTDGGSEWRTLRFSEETAEWMLDTAQRPTGVAVDPDYQVFRRLDPAETPPILRDVTLSDATTCVLAGATDDVIQTARTLAGRLLDVAGVCDTVVGADATRAPLLIIGARPQVGQLLPRLALEPAPDDLTGQGTAEVWTQRMASGHVAMVVAADNAEALAALSGPLPHYGRKSYLAFEQGRARQSGVWPAQGGPLQRRF